MCKAATDNIGDPVKYIEDKQGNRKTIYKLPVLNVPLTEFTRGGGQIILQLDLLWRNDFKKTSPVRSKLQWCRYIQDGTKQFISDNIVSLLDRLYVDDCTDTDRLMAACQIIEWRVLIYKLMTLSRHFDDRKAHTWASISGKRLVIVHVLSAPINHCHKPIDLGAYMSSIVCDIVNSNGTCNCLSSVHLGVTKGTTNGSFEIALDIELPDETCISDDLKGSGSPPDGIFSRVITVGQQRPSTKAIKL